mgnify:CR=1 FL=1
MIIGVPKEVKPQEFRIALTPHGAAELIKSGHQVLVERNGGTGAGFTDSEYQSVGAQVVASAAESSVSLFKRASQCFGWRADY